MCAKKERVASLERIWGNYSQKRSQGRLGTSRVPKTVTNSVRLSCGKDLISVFRKPYVLDGLNGVGW